MNSCENCSGECCRYVSVSLDPKGPEDWDEIKWFLMHKDIIVYKDMGDEWMIEFRTKCKHLDNSTNKCKEYESRPNVCKEHETHECDATDGDFAKIVFKKPEDVDEFLKSNPPTGHD